MVRWFQTGSRALGAGYQSAAAELEAEEKGVSFLCHMWKRKAYSII